MHRPIEAGMTLVSTATPIALLQRGSGTALVIHTETRTLEGELVNEQWVTEFFRGIDTPESAHHCERRPDDGDDHMSVGLTELKAEVPALPVPEQK